MKLVEVGGSIYGEVNRQWYRRVAERFVRWSIVNHEAGKYHRASSN